MMSEIECISAFIISLTGCLLIVVSYLLHNMCDCGESWRPARNTESKESLPFAAYNK